MITRFGITLALMNATMVVGTGGARDRCCGASGHVAVGTVAMALPLGWQIANMAGWVAQNITRSSRTSASCRTA